MGNPFQDQLLKAGLVNKKQVNKAKHEKRVSKKKTKKQKTQPVQPSAAELQQAAEKKRIKKLNKERRAKEQQQELQAQIKQLIEQNRIKQDKRGEAYNFVDGVKIKRIHVPAELAKQISCGQAGIVCYQSGYEVVPRKIVKQIHSRDPKAVLVLHDGAPEDY